MRSNLACSPAFDACCRTLVARDRAIWSLRGTATFGAGLVTGASGGAALLASRDCWVRSRFTPGRLGTSPCLTIIAFYLCQILYRISLSRYLNYFFSPLGRPLARQRALHKAALQSGGPLPVSPLRPWGPLNGRLFSLALAPTDAFSALYCARCRSGCRLFPSECG